MIKDFLRPILKQIIYGNRKPGSSSKIVKIPYDQAYTKDFEDMKRRVPDTSRIKNAIGWEQKITIDDTLKEIVDWMKK